ncbi:MAG: hypothetical protein K6U08_05175 [Firmicutes bacterium]|nr:hypothetical protein [Bacillota bacterium]
MGDVLDAFREGWRRLGANPVVWLAPLGLMLVGFFAAVLGAGLVLIPVIGVLVFFAGMLAYVGAGAAGMMGLLGAAVTRQATGQDFWQGVRRFFWRAVGLLLLTGLVNFVLAALFGSVVPSRALYPDGPPWAEDAFRALASPVTLALQFIAYFAVKVLFAFAPPAVAVDDCRTVNGIERGLGLVMRKPGPALGLLAVVVVLSSVVPMIVVLLFMGRLFVGGVTEQELAAFASSSLVPMMLLLGLYAYVALLLAWAAIFVFYDRNRSLLGAPSAGTQPEMPAAPEPPGGQVVGL